MKITLLRTLITACLLFIICSGASAQLSITGTVEADNLTISGAAYARSLTTSGAVEAGSITTTGNIGVLGSLYVQGTIFGNINITSLTALTTLSTTIAGSAIIGSGGLTVTGGSINTTGTVYASALSTSGVAIGNGISTSGTIYAGALSTAGVVINAGITTTGTIFAEGLSTSGVALNNELTVTGSASVTGTVTARSFSGTFLNSTSSTLTAAGTTQAAALLLPSSYNVVTTVTAAANGVRLNVPKAGETVTVVNKGASTLLIYPATSGAIDALGANVAIGLPADGSVILKASSTTQWYTNSNKANGIFAPSVQGTAVTSSNTVTTENDMMTYTLPANTLRTNNQTLRIKVFGTTSAANNAKTFRVYFGGTVVFTGAITANSANSWSAEVLIVRSGASTQFYSGTGLFNQTIQTQTQGTLAISETADIIIKTTAQAANTGQTLTQRAMIIELINDR